MAAYVVWDWNGTLFDDVALCIQVMNGMLEKRGLPRLAGPEQYRQVFTFPVEEYYKALGFDFSREPFSQLAVEYISEYDRRALGCPLRAGAEAALAELRRRGVKQVIASASHKKALEEQVAHLGVAGYFQALLGVEDSLGRGKSGLAGDFLRQAGAAATPFSWATPSTTSRPRPPWAAPAPSSPAATRPAPAWSPPAPRCWTPSPSCWPCPSWPGGKHKASLPHPGEALSSRRSDPALPCPRRLGEFPFAPHPLPPPMHIPWRKPLAFRHGRGKIILYISFQRGIASPFVTPFCRSQG